MTRFEAILMLAYIWVVILVISSGDFDRIERQLSTIAHAAWSPR